MSSRRMCMTSPWAFDKGCVVLDPCDVRHGLIFLSILRLSVVPFASGCASFIMYPSTALPGILKVLFASQSERSIMCYADVVC